MKLNVSAVVITKPGLLGDALQALVMAVVYSGIVYQVPDVSAALPLIAEHHPILVMLDAEKELSHASVWAAVGKMQSESPGSWYVVLVEDIWQQQRANLAGVEAILLKRWLPAAKLLLLLEHLISQQDEIRMYDQQSRRVSEEKKQL